MSDTAAGSRNGILSLTIKDKAVLYSAYGVQFSEQDAIANSKIENHLAGSLSSDRPTHTM